MITNGQQYQITTGTTKTKAYQKKQQIQLLQGGQQSTKVAIPKPHAHVILTQMNIPEVILETALQYTKEMGFQDQ